MNENITDSFNKYFRLGKQFSIILKIETHVKP